MSSREASPASLFSYAGKRGGRDDERYLWPQMLRAIDEARPTWVVGENVAGLSTMVEGGVFTHVGSEGALFGEEDDIHEWFLQQTFTIERICKDLERIGYSVQPVLIPAAAVGAPHRRDRIFIIARVADSYSGDDLRGSRGDEGASGASGAKGVQEWDEVRLAGIADKLRSEAQDNAPAYSPCSGEGTPRQGGCPQGEGCNADQLSREWGTAPQRDNGLHEFPRNAQDSLRNGCGLGQADEQRGERDERDTGAGSCQRICCEERAYPANAKDLLRNGGIPGHQGEFGGQSPAEFGNCDRQDDAANTKYDRLQHDTLGGCEAAMPGAQSGGRQDGISQQDDAAAPTGDGLLPTPTAGEAEKYRLQYKPGSQMGTALSAMAASGMLPTPQTSDSQAPLTAEQKEKYVAKHMAKGVMPSAAYQLRQMAAEGILPTPMARDYKNPDKAGSVRMERKLAQGRPIELNDLAPMGMLPTPRANKVTEVDLDNPNVANRNKANLEEEISKMVVSGNLPTPSARDWKGKTNPGIVKEGSGCVYGETLPDTIGRLTEPSSPKTAGQTSRLSPLFTEEMMGFPLMWTTLPFLSPNGAPKASKPTETP